MGEREILEWASYQGIMGATCRISELTQGRRYFFRANCGNIKGWGSYRNSVPASVVPSSKFSLKNKKYIHIVYINVYNILNFLYYKT